MLVCFGNHWEICIRSDSLEVPGSGFRKFSDTIFFDRTRVLFGNCTRWTKINQKFLFCTLCHEEKVFLLSSYKLLKLRWENTSRRLWRYCYKMRKGRDYGSVLFLYRLVYVWALPAPRSTRFANGNAKYILSTVESFNMDTKPGRDKCLYCWRCPYLRDRDCMTIGFSATKWTVRIWSYYGGVRKERLHCSQISSLIPMYPSIQFLRFT